VIFALGIGTPLLVLAVAGAAFGRRIIGFLTRHKSPINRIAGAAMVGISLYYLIAVFQVPQRLLGGA
jgi:cytochrome c biogenesis protein CcdA